MQTYKYNPSVSKKISNLSLYYDKFVYKERNLIKREIEKASKQLKSILKDGDRDNDIRAKKGSIRKISTNWVKINPDKPRDIRNMEKHPDKIIQSKTKKIYKERIFELMDSRNFLEEINSLCNVRDNLMRNLTRNYEIFSAVFSLKTKFLVGSGIPSIDEVGFYWSRNYSVPIIPGSSVKGAFRNFIREEFSNMDSKDLFGSTDKASKLTFFDAIPMTKPILEKVYQTPHFGEYYTKDAPPNDVYNPIPISFTAVSSGEYRFDFIAKDVDDGTFEKLKDVFVQFLKFYGIGAKTSMGFGRFEYKKNC